MVPCRFGTAENNYHFNDVEAAGSMVKSMTGFGRFEAAEGEKKIAVEIKSVNHRYLDLNMKLPKKLNIFESKIRSVLKEYMERGKVDVYITYVDESKGSTCVKYHHDLAEAYLAAIREIQKEFELSGDFGASSLSRYPDVLTVEEQQVDEETLWLLLESALRGAAERMGEARIREGEHLKTDLLLKLEEMTKQIAYIEERSPQILQEYRKKLTNKVQELLVDNSVDENRILTEVAIFADKICVDEEIVRLRSHVEHMKRDLKAGGSLGRKLDFLAQEMNREANTILSKANDITISECGVELKTDIEKVREQIQNIE